MSIERSLCVGLLTLSMTPAGAAPLLLTGQVEDARSQLVLAPRTDNWQIQVQWMPDEGSRVEAGDELVRFDPAGIDNRIEQMEATERQTRQRHQRTIDDLRLRLLESEINLARAEHRVRVTALDAGIPADFIPALTYERNQLEHQKALEARAEVQQQIASDRLALEMAKAEAELDARRLELELSQLRRLRDSLVVRAERPGFVVYASNRVRRGGGMVERVYPGDSVQAGDNVVQVSGDDALQVRVWIHEVDLLGLEPGLPVQIVFDARPGEIHTGRLSWISSQASARPQWGAANWFEGLVVFDAVPQGAAPGMSVRVEPLAEVGTRFAGGGS